MFLEFIISVTCVTVFFKSFHWFSNDTCRMMVGCQWCTYPSIRLPAGADSQDHGRLPVEHISKHSVKNLHTCQTPLSAWRKTWRELKKSRVATTHRVKHCAKITFCQHFLRPSPLPQKKRGFFLSRVWEARQDRQDNGQVRHFFFLKDSAWSSAVDQT